MTTHETFFFRDAGFWRAFETIVLPRLLTRERSAPVRLWSAACSTGQEAYSVAMAFAEHGATALDALELVATDVAEPSLDRARDGVFTALEVSRGLGPERLARHFDPCEGGYRVKERLRRAVRWEAHNLLGASAYPSRQDVVLCRNVLIYFGDRDRAEVVRRLFDAAAPSAFIGVGSTEVIKGRAIAPGWFVRES
jgi:chemotaxis protein methyltransferase CheR